MGTGIPYIAPATFDGEAHGVELTDKIGGLEVRRVEVDVEIAVCVSVSMSAVTMAVMDDFVAVDAATRVNKGDSVGDLIVLLGFVPFVGVGFGVGFDVGFGVGLGVNIVAVVVLHVGSGRWSYVTVKWPSGYHFIEYTE